MRSTWSGNGRKWLSTAVGAVLLLHSAGAYEQFKVAIYCTVFDVEAMADSTRLEAAMDLIQQHVVVDKVYLETHRRQHLVDEATLEKVQGFFRERGIKTSGGITPTGPRAVTGRFGLFCYSSDEDRSHLENAVRFTAKHFDEIILDDFYFTDCRCSGCEEGRGKRTWPEYRLELMREVSENLVMKPAKEVNPEASVIIKYPNWYAFYQNTGYNLRDQPAIFDRIYTGTETRDSVYHQQHLQPYQGYLIMRYLENVAPGRNGGGWVDPLDMRVLNRYAEQLSLTVFARAKEVTLFRYGSLVEWIQGKDGAPQPFSINAPVAGHAFAKADAFMSRIGQPVGLPVYRPLNSAGEPYLECYLGMLGMPLELMPAFPENAPTVLLTAAAAADPDIIGKMKTQLMEGRDVIITSGLLAALADRGIEEILSAEVTDRVCRADAFADLHFRRMNACSDPILLPIIEFPTNDAWKEIGAMSGEDSHPFLLQAQYANGQIRVLSIPDTFSDLYRLPMGTLSLLKKHLLRHMPVRLDAPAKVCLFLYDNNTCIIHSFLPRKTEVTLHFSGDHEVEDLLSGNAEKVSRESGETEYTFTMMPYSYRVLKW